MKSVKDQVWSRENERVFLQIDEDRYFMSKAQINYWVENMVPFYLHFIQGQLQDEDQ